jgi:mannose-6-phosphate isomerase-like protein (cupin superfamily)
MNAQINAPPLAGQTIGSVGDAFIIAEWQDPSGPPGPPSFIAPRHVHYQDDEAWYVLEGRLCFERGDKIVEACTGSAVFVPRGIPHTYWNPGTEPTRYLLIMTSTIFRLIHEIHATQNRSTASLQSVFKKYNSELLS